MCQTVITENGKRIQESGSNVGHAGWCGKTCTNCGKSDHTNTWGKLDGATKLVQTVVSQITRTEVVAEIPESDLVVVIGDKFWEETYPSQGQGAEGKQAAGVLKVFCATGIRPTASIIRLSTRNCHPRVTRCNGDNKTSKAVQEKFNYGQRNRRQENAHIRACHHREDG